MRRHSIWMLAGLTASLLSGTLLVEAAGDARRPNIVWIVAEDICPDLGCYGVEAVRTPVLDKLP